MEEQEPHLVLEATWCIANLTIGDQYQTNFLVNRGLLDILKDLINSKHLKILEQAAWVVANLAADNVEFKVDMLKKGFAEIITKKIMESDIGNIIKNKGNLDFNQNELEFMIELMTHLTWALSNLCRGQKIHNSQLMAVSAFVKSLVIFYKDEEIVNYCIHPINDIINKSIITELINSDFLKILKLIALTHDDSENISDPLIQILCTVSCLSSNELKMLSDMGFVDIFFHWLCKDSQKTSTKKEILYTISNFMVDSDSSIGYILKDKRYFDILIALCKDENLTLKREAIWCICNVTKAGSDLRKHGLVKNGIFDMFKEFLALDTETQILLIVLEGLENLLSLEKKLVLTKENLEDEFKYSKILEKMGVFNDLENLQTHENAQVYRRVIDLIEDFFEEETQGDVLSYFQPREDQI